MLTDKEELLSKPYQFGYEFADGLGMNQHRQEVADSSGVVKGSYGYLDPLDAYRTVEYIADKDRYKVVDKSNEPGISAQNSADTQFIVETPSPAAIAQRLKSIVLNSL